MDQDGQIKAIDHYVQSLFENDSTGHDEYHMRRVAHLARNIAIRENADVFTTEAAALLHDAGDQKLFPRPNETLREMEDFLHAIGLMQHTIQHVKEIIDEVSYRKGIVPASLEGKIVQDADRIDAIGAIGIARTFAYGGSIGQPIHHMQNIPTSIRHFYDKLLTLKDTMHTSGAKAIAEKRHRFLLTYLDQFWEEWEA